MNLPIAIYAFFGVLGCLWAALIVAAAVGGTAGRYALLRGYLRWKVGIQWYLVVLLSPAVVWAIAVGLDYLLTGSLPRIPAFSYAPAPLLLLYGFFLIRYMAGNFEEICWRASLLPRLQSRYSALSASLVVGVIQGLWHLPYVFIKGSFVQMIGLPAMVLLSITLGIVLTWVFNSTGGSLLLVALFHAAFDAWSSFQGSDIRLAYIMIGVWCVLAIIVLDIFGVRSLSRKPVIQEPAMLLNSI